MSDKESDSVIDRTEHHKTATKVVDKMHDPQNIHDKQMHTNMPKQLLVNSLILSTGTDGLRKLTEGDVTIHYEKDGKKLVTIMRPSEVTNADGTRDLIPFRTMSNRAWTENRYWGDFWDSMTGNLMELMMSIPVKKDEGGWRAEQGEREVASLVTGERQLMEASNQNKPGYLKRLLAAARNK